MSIDISPFISLWLQVVVFLPNGSCLVLLFPSRQFHSSFQTPISQICRDSGIYHMLLLHFVFLFYGLGVHPKVMDSIRSSYLLVGAAKAHALGPSIHLQEFKYFSTNLFY